MDTPNAPAPKKGLSGLAIAGLGCGGLLIIVGILAFILLGKACSKLGEVAGDFQKNPAKAAAMMALKLNPDIEIVSTNDARNEITFKTKSDGKTVTMSLDDVAQGKFTMTDADGKTTTIDGSQAAAGGGVTIKGPDGSVLTSGAAGTLTLPSWVPAYPGMKAAEGGLRTENAGKVTGMSNGETTDTAAKVKEFYEKKMKDAGFQVEPTSMSLDGAEVVSLVSTKASTGQKLTTVINQKDGKTSIMLTYEGPK